MQPWMSQREINTIIKYLHKTDTMLEYGCGGSTIHFCDYVAEYYSIEHNPEWYHKMSKIAKPNTKIYHIDRDHITPENTRIIAKNWDGLDTSSRSKDFNSYIHFPKNLKKIFDVVLVDGRARPECAKFIFDYLKDDGILFIHDYWNRKPYHVVEEKYKVIDAVKNGQSLAVFQKDI